MKTSFPKTSLGWIFTSVLFSAFASGSWAQNLMQGPASGTTKVIRGGTYGYQAAYCRSGGRGGSVLPDSPSVGFRLVFNP
jgi:hypothetical protein